MQARAGAVAFIPFYIVGLSYSGMALIVVNWLRAQTFWPGPLWLVVWAIATLVLEWIIVPWRAEVAERRPEQLEWFQSLKTDEIVELMRERREGTQQG
jgi:hypothetical protein